MKRSALLLAATLTLAAAAFCMQQPAVAAAGPQVGVEGCPLYIE
jgi:hypothetical protein